MGQHMIAMLVAVTISFTLPVWNDVGLFLRECVAGPAPCRDLRSVTVWRAVQSKTWVAKCDSMLADEEVWAKYWPTVRDEAAPQVIVSQGLVRADAGAVRSFTVPDTGTYFVTTRDDSMNVSCQSNWVTR